jgi:hypothetical protein
LSSPLSLFDLPVPPPLTPDGDVSDQPRRLQGSIFARNLLMKSSAERIKKKKKKGKA